MKTKRVALDQQTDQSCQGLYKIATAASADSELRQLLDNISIDYDSFAKLASHQFAYPEQRLYPVNDFNNTLLSKLYFSHDHSHLSEVEQRLDTFMELHSVPTDIIPETEKTAAEKDSFEPFFLLPSRGMCKVASSQDMDMAQKSFEKDHQNFPIPDRVEFAQNFVQHCKSANVHIKSPAIVKYAALLDNDLDYTREMMMYRVAASERSGQDGSQYQKLASELEKIEVKPEKKELKKLAETILELDEEHGFTNKKYDKRMPCAYGSVFCKEAKQSQIGSPDTAEDLDPNTATKAQLIARFGDGVLDEVENEEGELDRDAVKNLLGITGDAT